MELRRRKKEDEKEKIKEIKVGYQNNKILKSNQWTRKTCYQEPSEQIFKKIKCSLTITYQKFFIFLE